MKKNYILTLVVMLLATVANGQVAPPSVPPPPPPGLPIDGGIALLVASGIALGYRKLKKHS